MYRFDASGMVQLFRMLGTIEGMAKGPAAATGNAAVPGNLVEQIPSALGLFEEVLAGMGLPVSAAVARTIGGRIKAGMSMNELVASLHSLQDTVAAELGQSMVIGLSAEEAAFFASTEFVFGEEVQRKLSTVIEDGVEASKCFGLGRYTAAVFHLMRVMEIGVQKFGDKLGVTLLDSRGRGKNWQNLLDESNKAIRGLSPADPSTKKLAAIAANLYSVKVAWRNEVMHPKETYTEEEARDLIGAVRTYLRELASAL